MNLLSSSVIFTQNNNSEKHPVISTLYPGNPPLDTIDINSISIKLPSTGTTHVVSFLNKHSGNAVKVWAELLPMKKLKNSRIQFTNIVFPGGLFFMIPKSKAIAKIRKTITNEITQFQNDWPIEEKENYRNLEIHWIVDFKRKLFKTYDLNSRYSYLFLIDAQGRLLKKLRQDDHSQLQGFLQLLLNEIEKFRVTPEG